MFISFKRINPDNSVSPVVMKKSSIESITSTNKHARSIVRFTSAKKPPIPVPYEVEDFYNLFLGGN